MGESKMREVGIKGSLIALVFAALILGCTTPVTAQLCTTPVPTGCNYNTPVTTGFTIHVGFFYPYFALYNIQVTVNDQTGRIIATGISPDGSALIIGLRTETPIYLVTVRASGYANFGGPYPYPYAYIFYPISASYPYWTISGVTNTLPVATSGGDYWITVLMAKG